MLWRRLADASSSPNPTLSLSQPLSPTFSNLSPQIDTHRKKNQTALIIVKAIYQIDLIIIAIIVYFAIFCSSVCILHLRGRRRTKDN